MIRRKIAVTGVGAAMALATSVALAAPVDCSTGAGKRSFDAAYKIHAEFLEKIFDRYYTCRELEVFSDQVNKLTAGASPSDYCMAEGRLAAARATIIKITNKCDGAISSALLPEPDASPPARRPAVP